MSDKLRILVLDDSPVAAKLAASHLGTMGFEAKTATSLVQFEQVLKEFSPHVILSDVEMPEVSGDQICSVLRGQFETASIPILLFSGLEEADLSARAQRAGADGYICKNAGPAALKQKLDELMDDIVF